MSSWGHSALYHPLTFRVQLGLGVVHLDGVRLKTQGWRDTGIGGIGGGVKRSGPGKLGKAQGGAARALAVRGRCGWAVLPHLP